MQKFGDIFNFLQYTLHVINYLLLNKLHWSPVSTHGCCCYREFCQRTMMELVSWLVTRLVYSVNRPSSVTVVIYCYCRIATFLVFIMMAW